jgi:hypothetical protein
VRCMRACVCCVLCVVCCVVLCCVVCCVLCVVCVCACVCVCVCVFLSLSVFICLFLFVWRVDCPVCGVNAEILYVSVLWRAQSELHILYSTCACASCRGWRSCV